MGIYKRSVYYKTIQVKLKLVRSIIEHYYKPKLRKKVHDNFPIILAAIFHQASWKQKKER